jgi:hypothetical protein
MKFVRFVWWFLVLARLPDAHIHSAVQSGLSWLTILKRREAYRTAYADWDMDAIAAFGDEEVCGPRHFGLLPVA